MASQAPASPTPVGVTFDDAIRQFGVKLRADKASRDTQARYPKIIRTMAAGLAIADIGLVTADRVMAWLSETAVESEWSGHSHNNALSALNTFWEFCRDCGWIERSPSAGIRRAAEELGEGMRPFTMAEQEAILAVAPERRLAYTFARETGLRKGNQFANSNEKSVRAGMIRCDARKVVLPPKFLKNRKAITIPITAHLAEMLRPIVTGLAPDSPAFPEWLDNRTLFADMERAGVPRVNEHGEPAAWQSWRKGFLSAMAEGGVDPKTVQDLAGHSTITLTMRHYVRSAETTKRAAVEKIFARPANPVGSGSSGAGGEKNLTPRAKTVAESGVNGTMMVASQDSRMMALTPNHGMTRACRPDASSGPEKLDGCLNGGASPRRAVVGSEKPAGPFDPTWYATPWNEPSAGSRPQITGVEPRGDTHGTRALGSHLPAVPGVRAVVLDNPIPGAERQGSGLLNTVQPGQRPGDGSGVREGSADTGVGTGRVPPAEGQHHQAGSVLRVRSGREGRGGPSGLHEAAGHPLGLSVLPHEEAPQTAPTPDHGQLTPPVAPVQRGEGDEHGTHIREQCPGSGQEATAQVVREGWQRVFDHGQGEGSAGQGEDARTLGGDQEGHDERGLRPSAPNLHAPLRCDLTPTHGAREGSNEITPPHGAAVGRPRPANSAHPVTTCDAGDDGLRPERGGEPWSHDTGTATPAGTRREVEQSGATAGETAPFTTHGAAAGDSPERVGERIANSPIAETTSTGGIQPARPADFDPLFWLNHSTIDALPSLPYATRRKVYALVAAALAALALALAWWLAPGETGEEQMAGERVGP